MTDFCLCLSPAPLRLSPRGMPFFSSAVGSWAERMPNSVCVYVWVWAFHCLWGHEIAPKPQGTLGTTLPFLFPLVLTLISPPSFFLALRWALFEGIIGACMCDSSQLVAHPFVPGATFIPTSEPSVHQSLSPTVLLRRVTDTRRLRPQDPWRFKMASEQGQSAEYTCKHTRHLEGKKLLHFTHVCAHKL